MCFLNGVNLHRGSFLQEPAMDVEVSGIVCPIAEGRSCSFGDVEKALM